MSVKLETRRTVEGAKRAVQRVVILCVDGPNAWWGAAGWWWGGAHINVGTHGGGCQRTNQRRVARHICPLYGRHEILEGDIAALCSVPCGEGRRGTIDGTDGRRERFGDWKAPRVTSITRRSTYGGSPTELNTTIMLGHERELR